MTGMDQGKYQITTYFIDAPGHSAGRQGQSRRIRIAFLADLHEHDRPELTKAIAGLHPDLILLAGDILERHDQREIESRGINPTSHARALDGGGASPSGLQDLIYRVLTHITLAKRAAKQPYGSGLDFLRECAGIAPTCLSNGNHEWYYIAHDLEFMKEYGIHLLDNRDTVIRVADAERADGNDGIRLMIGGLSTFYDRDWLADYAARAKTAVREKKADAAILLVHNPDVYQRMIEGTDLDTFTLVLSGHYHGGQWGVGRGHRMGFYVPRRGFFIPFAWGRRGHQIITSGCANTAGVIPRINNPEEVVLIEMDV